jgi:gas vesicle protein
MNAMNFAKGMGVGLVVGSAVGMAVASGAANQKKSSGRKNNVVGKALRTMGDIVENIGDSIGM